MNVKGFSESDVTNSIFPVFTYTDFAFTLLAAPLSQALGCKACIVVGAFARVGTRLLLIYGTTLYEMQAMQARCHRLAQAPTLNRRQRF